MGLCVGYKKSKDRFKGHCGNNKEFIGFLPFNISKQLNQIPKTVVSTYEDKNFDCLNQTTSDSTGLEIMAGSFPNMNLSNSIKGLVSKKRNRYKKDGFDLDLTYITENIIAMGYPASKIESVYRNNIEDVVKFLDQKHADHYMIYNLCSERSYDKSKFHNRVMDFPFDDHNPPKIESIQPFCENVHEWLEKDPENVAVVHCKAGKGRTGTMICCYLLHSKKCAAADQALSLYGSKRTQNTKGVTIPSQVRYIKYYEQLIKNSIIYLPNTLYIKEFTFDPVPSFMSGPPHLSFSVSESFPGEKSVQKFKSEVYKIPVDMKTYTLKLDQCFRLTGDVKVEFYNKIMMRKEKLFQFWFNTFFVGLLGAVELNGYDNQEIENCYSLDFGKSELDKLNKKDKQHKIFSENFKFTMKVQKLSKSDHVPVPPVCPSTSQPRPNRTPSISSGASSEESDEDDWDSAVGDPDPELFNSKGVGYRILSECELASQLTSSSGENHSEILMV